MNKGPEPGGPIQACCGATGRSAGKLRSPAQKQVHLGGCPCSKVMENSGNWEQAGNQMGRATGSRRKATDRSEQPDHRKDPAASDRLPLKPPPACRRTALQPTGNRMKWQSANKTAGSVFWLFS